MSAEEGTAAPSQRLTRRQRTHQATRDEILRLARAQMRAGGAGALNLNELAHDLGMRTPSLYEYFPGGKTAIYDALFAEGFVRFAEMMAPAWAESSPRESLRRGLEGYLRFAIENPDLFQICFERPIPGFVPSEESLRMSFGYLAEGRAAAARALAQLGNPLGLTTDQLLNLLIATMHGIAAQHLANEPHLPVGEGRFGSLIPAASAVFALALPLLPESPDPSYQTGAPAPLVSSQGEQS